MTIRRNVVEDRGLWSTRALHRTIRVVLLISVSLGAAAFRSAQAQTGILQGTVSTIDPQGQNQSLPGASLKLTPATPGRTPASAVTNEQGEYKFTDLPVGLYTLQVGLEGFTELTSRVTVQPGVTTVENISLELKQVSGEVTVVAESDGLNTTDTAPPVEFKQDALQTLPLVNERFEDALPLVPGVLRGPDGQLNLKGARTGQSGLTVNSANVTDPVTGEYAINLPIEAIQSVEVLTNPYAPEYGEFTGAVTAVQTRSGSDKFNVSVQSIFPRARRRDGAFVGIGAFTPRVTFSGPLIKDKLKFIQSFEYRFVRTPVDNLPPLKRDTDLESFDSLSQVDWDIDHNNHLTTTFSLFPEKLRFVGLNTFNPQEVTPNFKQRGFFWAVNERRILNSKSVLDSSFSIKQFDADVFPSSGTAPMNLAPDVNSGNFFNRQTRRSKRYEALEVYSFSPPNFAGTHFMKAGAGVGYITYDGTNTSNSVRILRADGTRSQQIDSVGSGEIRRNRADFLAYFEDKWSLNRRVTLEYGVRYDRDNVAGENNFAPRISFAFLPILDGRTVLRGGVGLFYDKIDLNVATFTQMQERVLSRFGPDGQQVIGVPQLQRFVLGDSRFRTPRSVNWNIELDREWMKNLFIRLGYQQREGRDEFVLNPIESQNQGSILSLDNAGSSRYREFQVTARYKFREHDEFNASYVRSTSEGDLNDFNSYFGNFQNPIIRANERSRLPWDAPNRFIFWGEFHPKYGLTVTPVLDIRNGFPQSIIDGDRNFVGPRDRAGRFPTFVSLDMQVMKSINLPGRWKKYRAHLGVKVFNLTNHFNPRDFQNNLASADFGALSNGVGRKYGTRIMFEKK
jgi:Carboxypeptidase regulatory-like domain